MADQKRRIRARFNRAAPDYEAAAVLHREVEARVLERLDYVRLQPAVVLDIGAGPGTGSRLLMQRYPKAKVIALDLAERMLQIARGKAPRWPNPLRKLHCVCGDAESLPFASGSVDLIYSNLSLQWCADLSATFREFRRVLAPGGLLMFTTFGPDTLRELRAAWAQVDGFAHVNEFVDMHDIGDALVHAQMAEPVMDMEVFTLTYGKADEVMRDLKVIGAQTVTGAKQGGLTGRARLNAVAEAYESFRADGVLPATFEIVYGHAWAPPEGTALKREDGSVAVPLTGLRRS
ncbi:MAG: malonyl-ACP O-methyltransferase BioC [Gammaproteobacteria bacterium]|nr:malonyl-ACP O-methyltransferase BioC [Gammaproteobacteria bacterium]